MHDNISFEAVKATEIDNPEITSDVLTENKINYQISNTEAPTTNVATDEMHVNEAVEIRNIRYN